MWDKQVKAFDMKKILMNFGKSIITEISKQVGVAINNIVDECQKINQNNMQ